MNTLSEKVAYIKGLADGMKLDENSKEASLIKAMLDVMSDMAEQIQDNSEIIDDISCDIDDIAEHVDAVDICLAELEDDFDECAECIDDEDFYDFDDDYDDEYSYEMDCPKCGKTFVFEYEDVIGDGKLICPICGEEVDLDELIADEDDED